MGDGIIQIDELDITPFSGFTNGENITIDMVGATSGAGQFVNQFGEIQTNELSITVKVDGFLSQQVIIVQGTASVEGFWNDNNADFNIDNGEVSITQARVLFEDGQVEIRSTSQILMAEANFVDLNVDVINNGDLSITNGGSGFTTGTVQLIGMTSNAHTIAAFTDTIIVDSDDDGVEDSEDNCPFVQNPNQENNYGTSAGDVCEDTDEDSVNDDTDNCPINSNSNQSDLDLDFVGNACDFLNEINQSMTVNSSHSLIGDLIIDNNSVLTLSNNSIINIPSGSKLLVNAFSGFNIMAGSSFTIS